MTESAWIDLGRLILEVLGAISTVLAAVFAGLHWTVRREMVSRSDLARYQAEHDDAHELLAQRLAEGERQFAAIKMDIDHLPHIDDVGELKDRVVVVEGLIKVQTAMIEGLKEVLERIERPLNMIVAAKLKGD